MYLDWNVLLAAFATSEGYFSPGTPPALYFNPGDLDFEGQATATPHKVGGHIFAAFPTPGQGIAANIRQLAAYIQLGLSLREIVAKWAPSADGNNEKLYLSEALRRIKAAQGLEIDPDAPLHTYLGLIHIP